MKECTSVRSIFEERGREFTCVSDRMRDTGQGNIQEEIEGVFVCCRQASLERFIDRCVSERSCGDFGRTT